MFENDIRVGDQVRVVSGNHEGLSGLVVKVATPDDILFSESKRPLIGLLNEDMALIQYRQVNCFNEVSSEEIAIPVRRLQLRR